MATRTMRKAWLRIAPVVASCGVCAWSTVSVFAAPLGEGFVRGRRSAPRFGSRDFGNRYWLQSPPLQGKPNKKGARRGLGIIYLLAVLAIAIRAARFPRSLLAAERPYP